LLDKGYPLPSFKAMRRYISGVENDLKAAEAGQPWKISPTEKILRHYEFQSIEFYCTTFDSIKLHST
jgi:hypothetical protein